MTKLRWLVHKGIIAFVLMAPTNAWGTAVYDHLAYAHLAFSAPFESYRTFSLAQSTSGTGNHTESTSFFRAADDGNLGFFQTARVTGSAGNSTLDGDGTSGAYILFWTVIRFDFGSTPTDFSFRLTDWGGDFTDSTQLPWRNSGERITGNAYVVGPQFDGAGGYHPGAIIPNLTGIHHVGLLTIAHAAAEARYPYVVPEPATGSLLITGLTWIVAVRWQNNRTRRFRMSPSR